MCVSRISGAPKTALKAEPLISTAWASRSAAVGPANSRSSSAEGAEDAGLKDNRRGDVLLRRLALRRSGVLPKAFEPAAVDAVDDGTKGVSTQAREPTAVDARELQRPEPRAGEDRQHPDAGLVAEPAQAPVPAEEDTLGLAGATVTEASAPTLVVDPSPWPPKESGMPPAGGRVPLTLRPPPQSPAMP